MWKKIPDRFPIGLLTGIITLALAFLLVRGVRLLLVSYYGNEYMMAPPRTELYSIVINVIIFRFVLVRYDRENTAKGILFSTVILALVYFYFYFRYHY